MCPLRSKYSAKTAILQSQKEWLGTNTLALTEGGGESHGEHMEANSKNVEKDYTYILLS